MRSGVGTLRVKFGLAALCLWLSGAVAAAAPITYNEAASGELAGQNIGTFDTGANTVTGSEPFNGLTQIDSFLFVIAAGQQLDSIFLTSYTGVTQTFTLLPPGPLDTATRYGFLMLTPANVGNNILPALLMSDPGKTATAPLPAGTYQLMLTSVGITSYKYTFNVSAAAAPTVPEPATLTLTGLGLLGAVFARRRTARR